MSDEPNAESVMPDIALLMECYANPAPAYSYACDAGNIFHRHALICMDDSSALFEFYGDQAELEITEVKRVFNRMFLAALAGEAQAREVSAILVTYKDDGDWSCLIDDWGDYL